ncbi:hypothetical protein L484_004567 [Morus notabilis]|uniref:Uncharacterized protein n=1 Tax=Morus notabilis TaxID=981085 RepID=W9SUH0_9ROSA|nr:hypothetical protein L484_004567 [Morus notabilis]
MLNRPITVDQEINSDLEPNRTTIYFPGSTIVVITPDLRTRGTISIIGSNEVHKCQGPKHCHTPRPKLL